QVVAEHARQLDIQRRQLGARRRMLLGVALERGGVTRITRRLVAPRLVGGERPETLRGRSAETGQRDGLLVSLDGGGLLSASALQLTQKGERLHSLAQLRRDPY